MLHTIKLLLRKWCNLFNKPAIYFIMGTGNARKKDPLVLLEQALIGGISHFQLREKGPEALTGVALKRFALECQRLCKVYRVPFIVNDDVELAIGIGADGVHIGQDDLLCELVRYRIGKGKVLGVSVHSMEEAKCAVEAGANYLGMGPVFRTQSKVDAKEPVGVNKIMEVSIQYPEIPIVGIGGITPDNAESVWKAGVSGIAVISALAEAEDVIGEVNKFKALSERGRVHEI